MDVKIAPQIAVVALVVQIVQPAHLHINFILAPATIPVPAKPTLIQHQPVQAVLLPAITALLQPIALHASVPSVCITTLAPLVPAITTRRPMSALNVLHSV